MATLTNGRGWLNDNAANSLHRMDAARGAVIPLTDAGRSNAEQWALWNRWQAGGASNRPPYLYQPAYPGSSPHEAGNAIDIGNNDARNWVINNGGAYGWRRNIPSDIVHFIYEPSRDGGGSGGGGGSSSAGSITSIGTAYATALQTQLGVGADGIIGPITIRALQARVGAIQDGEWGPDTLTHTQRFVGAVPDGIWGPESDSKIKAAIDASKFGSGGSSGDPDILEAQQLLNKVGYGLVEDGVKGASTLAAIKDFQTKHGLTVDGIAGPATKGKLREVINGGPTAGEAAGSKWVGSPNFNTQNVFPKKHITLHWMVGKLAGTDAVFQRPDGVATTYGVGLTEVHQYVKEKDYAYGDGNTASNRDGISIEHEGGYLLADGVTRQKPVRATLDLSAKLVADIAKRHSMGKLVWMVNIFPHKHWTSTACPGPVNGEPSGAALDHEYIIAEANRINGYGGTTPPPAPPVVGDPDVLEAQQLLNKAGYTLVEDGVKGAATLAAIRDFQTKHGLEVDGIAGPITKAKLRAVIAAATPTEPTEPVDPEPEPEPVDPDPVDPEPVDPEVPEAPAGFNKLWVALGGIVFAIIGVLVAYFTNGGA